MLQQMMYGVNRHRPSFEELADPFQSSQSDTFGAPSAFCSTPRLVLGPDNHHLALGRKLKQQSDAAPEPAAANKDATQVGLPG